MEPMMKERNRKLAQKVIKGLQSRNMEGFYAETKEEALNLALGMMEKGATVGWGGSASIEDIGLKKAVCEGDYTVYNRDICKDAVEKRETEIKILGSDYFLCSCNAITEDGVLLNIDGNSNRVAAIAYGPKQVIMIVGMNKVAKDEDAAMYRARNIAAPTNAQRFDVNTPCKTTGACANCKSADSICCQFLMTRFSRHQGRIKVILINENIGY